MDAPNYQGPKYSWEDHYNFRAAKEHWMWMKRAEHWCSGKDLEYGRTADGSPHVRMATVDPKGKS